MRWRLALLVAAAMALVLVGFLVPMAALVRSVAEDRAVTGATGEAQALTTLVATTERAALGQVVAQLNDTARHPVSVFLPDGTVIGVPARRTETVELAARGRSVSVTTPDGREVAIAVQGLPDGTAVVRTFVGTRELRQGVARAWLILGLLGLALLVLGVSTADALARSVVRRIGELASVSHRLAAGEFEARAELVGPPELLAVGTALNYLGTRLRELIWQEREAAADLSHRLRTPLTALRLDAESLRSPDEAARIETRVDVLERAVSDLIKDSRRRDATPAACDCSVVVAERAAFWTVLAEDQDRALRVSAAPDPLPVLVGAADLAACLDALLGNVFAHTPDGAAFAIELEPRRGGGAVVAVEDAGPGFDTAGTLRRGASGCGSTGLGLDIARHTAEASGGGLTVGRSSALGGARVVVELGPLPPGHTVR